MIRHMPVLALAVSLIAAPAQAQDRIPSHCIAVADAAPGLEYLHQASFRDPLPADTVRINYIDHASFLIQTTGGLNAVTDFTGFIGNVDLIPDIVTMNHAHSTHWTSAPDPAIPHVLRGWGEVFGEGVDHYLDLGEMLVRNVPTDIRSFRGVEARGNSIFIFEVAGLCIGHLGHLHQEPSPEQYAAIGRLDVVMAPVDGGLTLDLPTMMRVVGRLSSSVVIPMHWFGDGTLRAFVDGMRTQFAVIDAGESSLELSLANLPRQPTIVVLRPQLLQDAD
ncbi:MBL fold metallo-hydrolase [Seohaeicola sp. SP36]|uniref:MBL fold metallo-hydrolase n=1 Tax=unclassified Seohaeicola TaxID=2641111 RepID=UPI00237B2CDD|nr:MULTISPECIES: MBL fold metallo-hydrolase [unclassified Seohaeicola]MDD9708166.1 MBL fold metallo-hydrolase [Seohaeicola sp. 4SK31]MDD9736130.1 MBL fold metallo-hydrolase [Seohaeicola sp. SP36]